MDAYDTFADAANTHALKVVLEGTKHSSPTVTSELAAATA
jgi:hypothetical protein